MNPFNTIQHFFDKPSILRIPKRNKFVIGVIFSSFFLLVAEYFLGKSGIVMIFGLSIISDIFLFWAMRRDLKEVFALQIFILPFFFSASFGFFYLLVPARFLTKIIMTLIYAFGLYSIYLSQNIFIVSSIRTIALLSGARTVSFFITIISYFLLMNVIFSLHFNVLFTILLIFISSFPLVLHSVWSYTLEPSLKKNFLWGILLSLCISEVSLLLWFWPSTPTYIALFLTGFFYIILGLSHLWFEKRLFRSVLIEYVWVALVVFVFLVVFTSWN